MQHHIQIWCCSNFARDQAVWTLCCLRHGPKIISALNKCFTSNLHQCRFVKWIICCVLSFERHQADVLVEHHFGTLYRCLNVISEYSLNVIFVWWSVEWMSCCFDVVWLSCWSYWVAVWMFFVWMNVACPDVVRPFNIFIHIGMLCVRIPNEFIEFIVWLLHVLNCWNAVQTLGALRERCVNVALCQLCERCLNDTGRCCVAGALPCMNLCDISVCFYCYGVIFWFDMNDSWAAVVAVLIIDAWSISAPLLHYHSIFLFTLTHFPPALSFSRSLSLPSGLNNDLGNNGQKNRTCLFLLPLFHLTFWLSLPRYHFLPHSFSVRAHLFLHAPGLSSISCERAEKTGKRRPAPLSPTV